jgi:acyl-CoA thioesterase-2
VPGPEGLAPGRYDNPVVESRDVPPGTGADQPRFARRAWFRVRQPLPPDPAVHQHALAYLSDHGPTRAAREPHAHLGDDARRQSVSLDHSVWFHRPVDTNAWLLSELVPMSTGRGRGLAIGTLRSMDGTLVATVAQEVLVRER